MRLYVCNVAVPSDNKFIGKKFLQRTTDNAETDLHKPSLSTHRSESLPPPCALPPTRIAAKRFERLTQSRLNQSTESEGLRPPEQKRKTKRPLACLEGLPIKKTNLLWKANRPFQNVGIS